MNLKEYAMTDEESRKSNNEVLEVLKKIEVYSSREKNKKFRDSIIENEDLMECWPPIRWAIATYRLAKNPKIRLQTRIIVVGLTMLALTGFGYLALWGPPFASSGENTTINVNDGGCYQCTITRYALPDNAETAAHVDMIQKERHVKIARPPFPRDYAP